MLAERFPESAEALTFYGAVASHQKSASPAKLLALVATQGPELLRSLAEELDPRACLEALAAYEAGTDRESPRSFFGRVLLQARIGVEPGTALSSDRDCPACSNPPQVGLLVREGDGTALVLSCSVCFGEWRHSKKSCPSCRDTSSTAVVHYHAPEIDHLELLACDSCRTYINIIRADSALDAVPDVDEITALPLDVWAHDNGYRKLVRNLVGI